jgi:hypothetical protein
MISYSFYTQGAFKFGDYYGHIALFPVLDDMKSSDSRQALRHWLVEHFAEHGANYELKI